MIFVSNHMFLTTLNLNIGILISKIQHGDLQQPFNKMAAIIF